MSAELSELFENECYIVRYSGEIPEIAYNSAIYYLTCSKNGPRITLKGTQVKQLKDAATERYREIILRDLLHENCKKPMYRGIKRSIVNYQRYVNFCNRQNLDPTGVKFEVAGHLQSFLKRELSVIMAGRTSSVINCSYINIVDFAAEIGLEIDTYFLRLSDFCFKDN